MTNVIILHGKPDDDEYYDSSAPSSSNFAWIPWLQKQCVVHELPDATPEVFRTFDATYQDWKTELERYDINENTILVGHSCGGGVLLRYLSENKNIRVKKLILVAPWFDSLKFMSTTFGFNLFDFERDPELLDRVGSCVVFHSDNDGESIQKTLDEIKTVWPTMPIRIFHHYGHFSPPEITFEFPELLEEVLK